MGISEDGVHVPFPCGMVGEETDRSFIIPHQQLHPNHMREVWVGKTGTEIQKGDYHETHFLLEYFRSKTQYAGTPKAMHRTKLNNVGPMCPVFQGRDNVRSIRIYANTLVTKFEACCYCK